MFPKKIFTAAVMSRFSGAVFTCSHWKTLITEIFVAIERHSLKLRLKAIVLSYEGCSIYSE